MSERSPKRIEEALVKDLIANKSTELVKRVASNNQIIKHNFRREVKRETICAHRNCQISFDFTLFPNQVIYPKYCEKHRSEFQRSLDESD